MKIVRSIQKVVDIISGIKKKNKTIGFVPTMGFLHAGHRSLLIESINQNQITICSIYVNPTQFNDKEDFTSYPRNESEDLLFLKQVNCDIVFLPKDDEIYSNFEKSPPKETYDFSNCMNILEGEKRAGHFQGVITIIHKLFSLIQPNRAYFGEKDYQQLWLIKLFVKVFQLPVSIEACSTIRNKYGLALSSRNSKLNSKEEVAAQGIFKAMQSLKKEIELNKAVQTLITKKKFKILKKNKIEELQKKPLIKLDYFEVIDNENFRFASEIEITKSYRVLIAAYVGETRLIDNILID